MRENGVPSARSAERAPPRSNPVHRYIPGHRSITLGAVSISELASCLAATGGKMADAVADPKEGLNIDLSADREELPPNPLPWPETEALPLYVVEKVGAYLDGLEQLREDSADHGLGEGRAAVAERRALVVADLAELGRFHHDERVRRGARMLPNV